MTWLKTLSGFRIKTPNIEKETNYYFFKDDKKLSQIAYILGSNGSGKTTIGKALQTITNGSINGFSAKPILDPVNYTSDTVKLSDVKIHVFNQEFINNNISLVGKEGKAGLKTIILIGQQGASQKAINEAQKTIELNESLIKEIEDKIEEEKKSTAAIKNSMDSIRRQRWADIKQKVDGHPGRMDISTIKMMTSDEPFPSVEELASLSEKLNQKIEEWIRIKNNTRPINLPELPECVLPIKKCDELLIRKVKPAKLTEREEQIRNLVSAVDLTKNRNIFCNSDITFCPTCFRAVDDDVRDDVLKIINRILDETTSNFSEQIISCQKELAAARIVLPELKEWEEFDLKGSRDLELASHEVNAFIRDNVQLFNDKLNDLSAEVTFPGDRLLNLVKKYNYTREKLECKKMKFLQTLKDGNAKDELKNQINKINNDILRAEVSSLAEQYRRNLQVLDKLQSDLYKKNEVLRRVKDEKVKAENELRNINIAVDKMNEMLCFIFGSKSRLRICVDGDAQYRVSVRNKNVAPVSLSVGEQNALALVYFFTNIAAGEMETKIYAKPMLLMIDDPISSFDTEVQVGMLSFIKDRVTAVLSGNPENRVIVTTHDPKIFLAFHRFFKKLDVENSKTKQKEKFNGIGWRLQGTVLTQLKGDHPEAKYRQLLEDAYNYAATQNPSENQTIANELRRVLEAATTYHFLQKYDSIDFDGPAFNKLNSGLRHELKNLSVLFCLHSGSHEEENVKVDPEWVSAIIGFSPQEIQRVAKVVLCFLEVISPEHVKSHRGEDKAKTICGWMKEFDSV